MRETIACRRAGHLWCEPKTGTSLEPKTGKSLNINLFAHSDLPPASLESAENAEKKVGQLSLLFLCGLCVLRSKYLLPEFAMEKEVRKRLDVQSEYYCVIQNYPLVPVTGGATDNKSSRSSSRVNIASSPSGFRGH